MMEERIAYQVMAPESVAWHIQAALVADRSGNVAARDVALAEAQRIAAERRLVDGPRYDCRTTTQRLGDLEARMEEAQDTLSILSGRIDNYSDAVAHRLAVLEEWREVGEYGERIRALEVSRGAKNDQLNRLEITVRNLQRLAQQTHGPEAGL